MLNIADKQAEVNVGFYAIVNCWMYSDRDHVET